MKPVKGNLEEIRQWLLRNRHREVTRVDVLDWHPMVLKPGWSVVVSERFDSLDGQHWLHSGENIDPNGNVADERKYATHICTESDKFAIKEDDTLIVYCEFQERYVPEFLEICGFGTIFIDADRARALENIGLDRGEATKASVTCITNQGHSDK